MLVALNLCLLVSLVAFVTITKHYAYNDIIRCGFPPRALLEATEEYCPGKLYCMKDEWQGCSTNFDPEHSILSDTKFKVSESDLKICGPIPPRDVIEREVLAKHQDKGMVGIRIAPLYCFQDKKIWEPIFIGVYHMHYY